MDVKQWLFELINFNTISSNSNLECIKFIEDWFKTNHINTHIIYGDYKDKANLFATIPAENGQIHGGLLLSAHTDVVPVAGQAWDSDPFIAYEKDEKIFGRGACDMKGFIAVLLSLLPKFKTLKLQKPLHFSFSYDEEVGCIGVEDIVNHLKKMGIFPEGCIVGEPSSLHPIVGEKGRSVYHCQVQGLSSHSSLPDEGCNAIEYGSKIINYIRKVADDIKNEGPFDDAFDIPYTTVMTNIISGGSASNVVPGGCEFIFEIRALPNHSEEDIVQKIEHYIHQNILLEMRKIHPGVNIYVDKISSMAPFHAIEDATITKIMRKYTGTSKPLKVSYATEAGIFQEADIPTVIWGPGSIQQAHKPNEFIKIEQLLSCERMLLDVVQAFCVNLDN